MALKAKRPELPELAAPTSLAEAAEYERKLNQALKDRAEKEEEKGKIEIKLANLEDKIAQYSEALYEFAERERSSLKDAQEISLSMGGTFSWVKRSRVVMSRKAETIIRTLKRLKLGRFVRQGKETLNKKLMHDEPEKLKNVPGISLKGVELPTLHLGSRSEYLQREPDKPEWTIKTPDTETAAIPQAAE